MGIVESFVFRRWARPARPTPRVLDADRPSLAGVGLGEPAERLREVLGPPGSHRAWRRGMWLYPDEGLRFDVVDDTVDAFYVVLQHPEQSLVAPVPGVRWRSFSGQVTHRGQEVPASRLVTRRDLEAVLARPSEVLQEEGETILVYARKGWVLEASLHPEGPLLSLCAQSA